MELYSSVWHIISALLVFLSGAMISFFIGKRFAATTRRSMSIYCWHTLLCLVYCWNSLVNGGDAVGYYMKAQIDGIDFSFGTAGVDYLTAILVQIFGLSLIGCFLVFNIFGSVGLQVFDACLRTATNNKPRAIKLLATLIIFLPSVSFWSSAIGKDSLSFLATCLALFSSLSINRRWLLMAFSVALMLVVRPHISAIMIAAWSFSILISEKSTIAKKIVLGTLTLVTAAVIFPFALKYAGIGENIDVNNISSYIEQRQAYNMEGGSGIDISSMSLPMQLITYMFRPFIFEVNSAFSFAAAIDNLVLLYLFMMGGWGMLKRRKSGVGESRSFILIYSGLAWITLAMTTANLGIALRQKWMFAPLLIFAFISLIGKHRRRKFYNPNIRNQDSNLSDKRIRQNL